MIHDGYTINAAFDSRRFSYRPALSAERASVLSMLRAYRESDTAPDIVRSTIRRHLEWENTPFEYWSDSEQQALFLIIMGKMKPQHGHPLSSVDTQNLYDGVLLELRHPTVAKRSCDSCKKFWYDDETGKIIQRGGKPMLRPADTVLLCQTVAGCPKGTPENPKGLSPRNRMAWNHFRDCEAVRQFPDDPIVRRNARIIRMAMAAAKRRAA